MSVELGVPKDVIVLALLPEHLRQFSGHAVAGVFDEEKMKVLGD